MNKEFKKSLAESGKDYIVIQGRIRDGKLHIQGKGPYINRDYGVATNIPVADHFIKFMESCTHSLTSLVTDRAYVPMQFRVYPDNWIHIQIKGPQHNRNYGAVLDVKSDDLLKFAAA